MSNHTPAPWKTGKKNASDWYKIFDANNTLIARAYDPSPTPNHKADGFDIEEANARLIAASPNLLEACKAAYRQLHVIKTQLEDGWWGYDDDALLDTLDTAIYEAEGAAQ